MVFHFIDGALGCAIIEVYRARGCFDSGKHELPKQYRQATFYFVILLSVLAAGYLATIIPGLNDLTAFGVGAAAPTLVTKLVKKAALVIGD